MAPVLISSPERKFRTACNAAPNSTSSDSARLFRLICTGAIVVLGGSFHFGYQISIINPMADVLQSFIENGLTQLNNSSFYRRVIMFPRFVSFCCGMTLGYIFVPKWVKCYIEPIEPSAKDLEVDLKSSLGNSSTSRSTSDVSKTAVSTQNIQKCYVEPIEPSAKDLDLEFDLKSSLGNSFTSRSTSDVSKTAVSTQNIQKCYVEPSAKDLEVDLKSSLGNSFTSRSKSDVSKTAASTQNIQDHDYDKPNFSISAIPTPTTPPVVSSPRLVAIADPVTPRVSNEKKVGGMGESIPAGAPQPAEKKLPRKQKKAKKLSKSKARATSADPVMRKNPPQSSSADASQPAKKKLPKKQKKTKKLGKTKGRATSADPVVRKNPPESSSAGASQPAEKKLPKKQKKAKKLHSDLVIN